MRQGGLGMEEGSEAYFSGPIIPRKLTPNTLFIFFVGKTQVSKVNYMYNVYMFIPIQCINHIYYFLQKYLMNI